MNKIKSHFWYTKSQRNGILFLLTLIIILQIILFSVDFSSSETITISSPEIKLLQKEIDSLKKVEIAKRKPKIYPFNPNFITDYKGYKLGMSTNEIDRLLAYRKENKWINSVKEFQKVTKVSDSLLNKISPYFKFPEWVIKKNKTKITDQNLRKQDFKSTVKKNSTTKTVQISTNDINKATAKDFSTISGVDQKTALRITKYRSKLKGYTFKEQLYEVWGLTSENANRILKKFSILEKPNITKINVNTASFKDVLKNPYIDYELCKKIFDYRDEVAELQNINELKNIEGFPISKYEYIILYLTAK